VKIGSYFEYITIFSPEGPVSDANLIGGLPRNAVEKLQFAFSHYRDRHFLISEFISKIPDASIGQRTRESLEKR
jgi:hypothetical protein